jgi:hypothetical protein
MNTKKGRPSYRPIRAGLTSIGVVVILTALGGWALHAGMMV